MRHRPPSVSALSELCVNHSGHHPSVKGPLLGSPGPKGQTRPWAISLGSSNPAAAGRSIVSCFCFAATFLQAPRCAPRWWRACTTARPRACSPPRESPRRHGARARRPPCRLPHQGEGTSPEPQMLSRQGTLQGFVFTGRISHCFDDLSSKAFLSPGLPNLKGPEWRALT